MDGPGISDEHVHRLSGVPRATRQDWAKAGLIGKQTTPMAWEALREVVVLKELRDVLGASSGDAVFRQLRAGLPEVAQGAPPVEAVIDLHWLEAEWISSDSQIAAAARFGNAVRVIDVTETLARARRGFDVVARERTPSEDELAKRRPRQPRTGRRRASDPPE
ncbi:MAG: hypothetical protein QOJ29_4951 [Thermoleophilaceae bacterium]|jgi:hypothetical protein|nr:hypothetical protein [Solirubrobacteraceae bacterium]MEA2497040.1 hypothetical protein [Thermoleophilaceae bacterium]